MYIDVGRHWDMMANDHITLDCKSYEIVKIVKYLDSLLRNQNYIGVKIKCRLNVDINVGGNSCYYSVLIRLFSLCKNFKSKIST
jgi:hypothetical protein